MQYFKIYLHLLIAWIFFFQMAYATPEKLSEGTDVTLKNGLRVSLKKSNLAKNEFAFQLFALGGYGHFSAVDRPSAWLSAPIAWESGINGMTGDELECFLDDRGVEMKIAIKLFGRKIEASGPTHEIAHCLDLTKQFFTKASFSEAGFHEVLTSARKYLEKKERKNTLGNDRTARKINLRNWHLITPFTPLDLAKADLFQAEKIFKKLFTNPADFSLILVGDFNPEEVLILLEESLGSLPGTSKTEWTLPSSPPPFPPGVTKKVFYGVPRFREGHTRLTFPFPNGIDPALLDLSSLILKNRLASSPAFTEEERTSIDVNYALPLFPYMKPSWMEVEFSSPVNRNESVTRAILQQIDEIKQKGITIKESSAALEELAQISAQVSDNDSLLSLLVDSYFAKCDLWGNDPSLSREKELMFKNTAACYPDSNNYTMISLQP